MDRKFVKAKRTGRKAKLTPEVQKAIVSAIQAGNYIETAAAFAGIAKDTLYRWLKRGARTKKGPYKNFSDAVEKALAEAEIRDVLNITKAGDSGNWQASAWRLERKFPDRWGRRDRYEITGKDGGAIQIALEKLLKDLDEISDEQLNTILGQSSDTSSEDTDGQ